MCYLSIKTNTERDERGEMNVGHNVISANSVQMESHPFFFFLIKEVIKLLPIVAAMVTGRFSGGESEASDNGRKWKLPLRPHFY